jgi:hypothetical protein
MVIMPSQEGHAMGFIKVVNVLKGSMSLVEVGWHYEKSKSES